MIDDFSVLATARDFGVKTRVAVDSGMSSETEGRIEVRAVRDGVTFSDKREGVDNNKKASQKQRHV